MISKSDSLGSSNEEMQSSGISSMSDEPLSSENGGFTKSPNRPPGTFERWSEDCYICTPEENGQYYTNGRGNPPTFTRQHLDNNTTKLMANNGINGYNNGRNFSKEYSPNQNYQTNSFQTEIAKRNFSTPNDMNTNPGPFNGGFQNYSPFSDMDRSYFPDSDLETIEEESSVLESDFDDRSSIGYDRKRSSSDFHHPGKHHPSGSFGSTPSNSYRESVTSAATASDEERSSSTLSSLSPKRSSISSRSDRSTPNNEHYDSTADTDRSYRSSSSQPRKHSKTKTHGYEKVAAIDPNAQQKIVYAKCFSPKEAARMNHNGTAETRTFNNAGVSNHVENSTTNVTSHSGGRSHHPRTTSAELTISDMFEAVKNGDIRTLNKFSTSEQCETVDERGNTILHAASEAGHLQCVRLLATGSSAQAVSLLNDDLMTPTALAVKNGHLCCVQWMLQNTSAKEELIVSSRQASIDGSNMRPPLAHVAARFDQDAVLDWLCEQMANENYPVDSADHHSNTAVHEAAAYGHLKCLQTLISRGASVTVLNSHGDTPGQVADKNGHDLCVGYLVVVETCMSLAQQLITFKLDNEGIRKENDSLRVQLQSINNARIAHAKESVEERIKATLKSLSPYEEDNENMSKPVPRPQPKILLASTPGQTTASNHNMNPCPSSVEISKPPSPRQVTIASASTEEGNTSSRFATENKSNKSDDRKLEITTRFATAKTKQPMNEIPSQQVTVTSPKSSNVTEKSPRAIKILSETKHSNQNSGNESRNVRSNRMETSGQDPTTPPITFITGSNEQRVLTGYDDHSDNKEVEELSEAMKARQPQLQPGKTTATQKTVAPGSQAVKAWEKMTMDEMLRMARDTRYLPSPTVSMCTEDSTMESREVMRERLAEASRWFLVQQRVPHGGGTSKDPRGRLQVPQQRPPIIRQNVNSSNVGNSKKIDNTASWVLGVQKSKLDSKQHRNTAVTVPFVPQNFINATNQQYQKLQTQASKNRMEQESPQSPSVSSQQDYSPPSITSSSSGSFHYQSRLGPYSPGSKSNIRPTSASSSCSTASTVKTNLLNSSYSNISKSSHTSHDTVVENGWEAARWRSNAELVGHQTNDPLQKRRTPLTESPVSVSSRKDQIVPDLSSSPKKQDDVPVSTSFHENPLSASETAELRVILPSRNNSFLRKVQPSQQSSPQQSPHCETPSSKQVGFSAPKPYITPVVSYPSITTKPPSPSSKHSFSTKLRTLMTSSKPVTSSKPLHPSSIQYSTANEIPTHKVEIVSPSEQSVGKTSPRKENNSNSKGYVMWKPSSTHIQRHEESSADTSTSPKLSEKTKKSKHSPSSASKQPYGGLFSSTSSPKITPKRKTAKLFHF